MRSLLCVSLLFALLSGSRSFAQVHSDTLFCAGSGILEAVPDPDNLYHLYGTGPGEFDIGSEFVAFDSTFTLHIMDGVASRWSADSVRVFINLILNDDPYDTDDMFPKIWNYFCHQDEDESYEGIEVNAFGQTFKKINIYLFDIADIGCPNAGYFYECAGDVSGCLGSSYLSGYVDLVINASEFKRQYGVGCTLRTVTATARRGFGHEVQHACYTLNGHPAGYTDVNESLSTLAEWIAGAVQEKGVDVSYDASIYRYERCDPYAKYYVEQVWMAYLYEVADGGNADITDDLVYRWLDQPTITVQTLANVLADSDFGWIGGSTGDERFIRLFQDFAVAKFANAVGLTGDGRFGYDEYDPEREVGLFEDVCTTYWGTSQNPPQTPVPPDLDCPRTAATAGCPPADPVPNINSGCWNVRIVPPDFTLDGAIENDSQLITDVYTLDVSSSPEFDGSVDLIDVALYGTDYIVFRADDYYDDSEDHEFRFELREVSPAPSASYLVKVSVIGYDTADGDLNEAGDHIVFVRPLQVVDNSASLVVTRFGTAIKAIVVVVTMVEADPTNDIGQAISCADSYYFTYEYEFGVVTPDMASSVQWSGDVLLMGDYEVPDGSTLAIAAGTEVRVWTNDLAETGVDESLIEFWIEGDCEINGSLAQPVEVTAWDMAGESVANDDWWGIFVESGGSGTFDRCVIKNANYAVQGNDAIALSNCLIETTKHLGLSVANAGTVTVEATTIRGSRYGINALLGTDLVLINSSIEDCTEYGVALYKDSRLTATGTVFDGNDIGLYLARETESWVKGSVYDCTFSNNVDGIWIDEIGDSTVAVDDCVIDDNTTNGIYVAGDGDISITRNTITNNTIGVYSDDSSPRIRSRNVIQYNAGGIKCDNFSAAVVESCTVNNNTNAVAVVNSANPDLGHASGGSSLGQNIMRPNTAYHVSNLTSNTIIAENNYWPRNPPSQCSPVSTKFYGPVDYSPDLGCSAPSLISMAIPTPVLDSPNQFSVSQNYPNPFNPTTTVSYEVPNPGSRVEIILFDVAGRLVRTLVNEHKAAGTYQVGWDGSNVEGQPVASGVYFLRMRAGTFVETKKLVMLK